MRSVLSVRYTGNNWRVACHLQCVLRIFPLYCTCENTLLRFAALAKDDCSVVIGEFTGSHNFE